MPLSARPMANHDTGKPRTILEGLIGQRSVNP